MLTYSLMSGVGVLLALHLAMHAQVGRELGNVRAAHAIFMCIGALVAIILAAIGWEPEVIPRIGRVPWYLFTAGAIGSILVVIIAWAIPRIGAGPAMMIMLVGQVATGAVISHFGWFESPILPLTIARIIGVILMIGGGYLAIAAK